jgi:hypothetical protein
MPTTNSLETTGGPLRPTTPPAADNVAITIDPVSTGSAAGIGATNKDVAHFEGFTYVTPSALTPPPPTAPQNDDDEDDDIPGF